MVSTTNQNKLRAMLANALSSNYPMEVNEQALQRVRALRTLMLLTTTMLQVVDLSVSCSFRRCLCVDKRSNTPPEDVVELEEGQTASRRKRQYYFYLNISKS